MYQHWDEAGGHAFMLDNRRQQTETGRLIPQVNEEYGYEDHYPKGWGGERDFPARIPDNRRRLAWEIAMAGCYQTTGERAGLGTGAGRDTGGGWINGRGDDSMTLLADHARMVAFFTSTEWWKYDPRPDLIDAGAYLLAEEGLQYIAYRPAGGTTRITLGSGTYRVRRFNPRTGTWHELADASGAIWRSPYRLTAATGASTSAASACKLG